MLSAASGDHAAALRLAGGKSAALEQLILGQGTPSRFTASLYAALGRDADGYLRLPDHPSRVGGGLFFKEGTVSISQLQSYFVCPYRHFIDYGLRAERPESGEADAMDTGAALHKAGELYAKSGFNDAKLPDIADEALGGGKYAYKQNERLRERLRAEIFTLCGFLGRHIKRGDFRPLGAELRFGKTGRLKGCDIGGAILKGSIDYADTMDGYIRIVDYKTGYAEFTQRELYYGRKLQLPLYMHVMRENGYLPAAMLYFIFRERWEEKEYKFNGIFLADKRILLGFDREMTEENAVVNAKIRTLKSGAEKITGRGAVSAEDFDAYIAYAVAAAQTAAMRIREGHIPASPLKDGGFLACFGCEYLHACGNRGVFRSAGRAEIITDAEEEA
jgi:ATP-dependent helicase/nuclease subunit B